MKTTPDSVIDDIIADAQDIEDPATRATEIARASHGFGLEEAARLVDAAYGIVVEIEDPKQRITVRSQIAAHVSRLHTQILKNQAR